MSDSSPHFMNANACFDAKKETSQATEQDHNGLSSSSSSSSSPINAKIKNQKGTRKTSKTLESTRSFRTKGFPLRVKSTCASAIKNSKFPEMCDKLCSYRHCSLNKNSQGPEPDKRLSRKPDGELGTKKNRARVQDSCKPQVASVENQKEIEVEKMEKILLADVSDQSSDSPPTTSDQTTLGDQETLENNNENNDSEESISPQEEGAGSGECTQTLLLLECRENEIPPDAIETIYQDKKVASEEEPKHIRMWHMVSQHVLSGVISKAGAGVLEGTDEEEKEEEEEVHTIGETKTHRDFSRDDAIEVVKEVVNEILITHDSPQAQPRDDSIAKEEGKKLVKSENWRKVKKLVILRRSIAALQDAKRPERVNLRHHVMEERKKAEQWMIDYALQNIVSKLTPSRKRRVAMLVEAFEAVVPFP